MAGRHKKSDDDDRQPPVRPSVSREARQARMENLALDLIEKRLLNGDASSQETTLFAKSASTRGKLEEERLKHEMELMKAKKSQIESQEELQTMFREAISAMSSYRMEGDPNEPIGDPTDY